MAKQLVPPDPVLVSGLSRTAINNTKCITCSKVALCLGHDVDLDRDICVCPLNHLGSRCFIPFDPCTEKSCNQHGQCIPLDGRSYIEDQFFCVCNEGWTGPNCEYIEARIHVSFARNIPFPSSNIALIHAVDTVEGRKYVRRFTYFHRLRKETSNFTVFMHHDSYLPSLIFIQLYENQDQFDYYLLY
ncbi:unnamed protein product, partial [Rotaria sp. Silwood1]